MLWVSLLLSAHFFPADHRSGQVLGALASGPCLLMIVVKRHGTVLYRVLGKKTTFFAVSRDLIAAFLAVFLAT